MVEIWKDIPSYEGKYQASNFGNIKSLNFHRENRNGLLKTQIDKYGYLRVNLYQNGKMRNYQVHRLVMLTFKGESNLTINHKDENKLNNKLENLEYTTIKENVRYSQAFKVIGENIENGKKIYFNSTREVNKFGFSQRCVCRALNGEQKQTKGYKFYYLK